METLPLPQLRAACGLSVSDIHRISDVSRATLHKLERGEYVRFDTAAHILQKMYDHRKCERAAVLISEELKRIGAPKIDRGIDKNTIDRLEAAEDEINMLLSSGESITNPKVIAMISDLRDAADELLKQT
jgi:transcriptional regulator with XRE-family HTH domain